MSSLSMVEAKLPPGFRFHPRDDELVCDYLMKKWNGCESTLLIDVDLNKCEPWDIPDTACVGGKDWYFYSQRDRKYATGLRTNRATVSGYWKATGKDRPVVRKGSLVGMRKTLVFYQGRAPKGRKTEWVMHEFRVEGPFGPPKTSTFKEDWVLCRVFYKNRDEGPSKSSTSINDNNCYDHESGSSASSLPPLMDSYISFNHHTQSSTISDIPNYQQVPCFSNIYSPTQNSNNNSNPNPTILPHFFQLHPNNHTKTHAPTCTTTFGGLNTIMPENIIGSSATKSTLINPLACDKKAIEAVLSHLTKMDNSPNLKGSPPISLGEGGEAASSESYLSDVAFPPNMWNYY